ncbi:tetratricopeptide repeat protein 1 isoform X2 [Solea solea]|nr:tetratricopeptide repeat protein 1 isoform X2 [Solea solea]XP_058483509.1 tetratricopeptide repeat protein 1 isoform X2 [Solea solea]XP_058483510.1 tetratricopeptide repeat protein 1 isoform X2 [Solea solea]
MNREQRHGNPARQEEEEQELDDFYDCEETLEPAHCKTAELQHCYIRPETLTDRGEEPRGGHQEQRDKLQNEEQQSDRLQQEEEQQQSDRLQDEEEQQQSDRLQEQQDKLQKEEQQNDRLQEEEQQSDMLQEEEEQQQSDRLQEEEQCDRLQEEEEQQSDRLQEEEEQQSDRLQEEEEDLDSEMQQQVEFDDDYLREVEKELTDEEKESRRQQSLTLKETGNGQFKAAEWAAAERTYSQALVVCPVCFSTERAVLFSNRAAARAHLGVKERAISDCSRAIELNPDYVRALLRRAELYEQTEKLDEALDDYKKVLERDPNNGSARGACTRLPQQIQDRNEKLKEEMMGKLKDLGNMILRPFGLSTNNFQVNQDQNTGSYSVNFVQNNNNR